MRILCCAQLLIVALFVAMPAHADGNSNSEPVMEFSCYSELPAAMKVSALMQPYCQISEDPDPFVAEEVHLGEAFHKGNRFDLDRSFWEATVSVQAWATIAASRVRLALALSRVGR